jgi:hypothetical protein
MRLSKLIATALCVGAVAFSLPALAQIAAFKLVILWGDSGVYVVDYPTAARCKAAKAALERRKSQELERRKPEFPPGGGIIIPRPWIMEMICIPG